MTPSSLYDHNLPDSAFTRLSYSSIRQFMKSPSHFLKYRLEKETSAARQRGSLFDEILLSAPEVVMSKYHVFSEEAILQQLETSGNPRGTKIYKEWYQAETAAAQDKIMVSAQEYLEMHERSTSLRAAYPDIFGPHVVHASNHEMAQGHIDGLEYIGFADRIYTDQDGQPTILDIKTTQDAGHKFVNRSFWDFGYNLQAAIYRELFGIERVKVLAVELAAPFIDQIYTVDEQVLDHARTKLQVAHARFVIWDRKPAGYSIPNTISLPPWQS